MKMDIAKYTGGVDAMDIAGGAAGLAAATLVPGLIIKTTTTSTQKWLKIGMAALVTIGLGMAAKKFMPSAAKAVVIGGLAGTASQVIYNVTGKNISGVRAVPAGFVNRPAAPAPMAVNNSAIGQTTKPEFESMPSL